MTKISAMSQDTAPTITDYFPSIDAETGANKRVTISDLMTLITATMVPPGLIMNYGGKTSPTGWQMCYGQAISRTTYANMFAAICPLVGTFTVTIAAPGIFTLTSHGLNTGDTIYLTTTGALPTGLSANTIYYVTKIDANTFKLATSRVNAYAATNITTTGSQSGTHSLRYCPFGLGDGSTTFNVPDLRGRTAFGNDYMGGVAASRLTASSIYGNAGSSGGAETHNHTMTPALAGVPWFLDSDETELVINGPAVSIASSNRQFSTAWAGGTRTLTSSLGVQGVTATGNGMNPALVTNYVIKE